MKIILASFLVLILYPNLISQVIEKPNFSSATHPITVDKIEFSGNQTIINLSIQNQVEKGYFCADKNIYILDAMNNVKYKLIQSQGIPTCPSRYKFKSVGEILSFRLVFPKLGDGVKFISIFEGCNQNCFSIKGIVLDDGLNKEIDLGYENYAKGKLDFSLSIFMQTVKNHTDYPFGVVYFNIIQILAEKNDFERAKIWYKQLANSALIDKSDVISRLKDQAYYSKLIF